MRYKFNNLHVTLLQEHVIFELPTSNIAIIMNCLNRNIKDFMFQTGDPTGTGKGGTSIWGRKFDDEFHETLKVYIITYTTLEPVQFHLQ